MTSWTCPACPWTRRCSSRSTTTDPRTARRPAQPGDRKQAWRGVRLRSGAAVGKDAELVALGVGQRHPAELGAVVDEHRGTEPDEPRDLLVLGTVGWADVEVDPVLNGLALGHVRECQRRWHRATLVLAFGHQRGANRDKSVVFALHLVVKDRAPEPGEAAGIGTVDRKLGELTGHARGLPVR